MLKQKQEKRSFENTTRKFIIRGLGWAGAWFFGALGFGHAQQGQALALGGLVTQQSGHSQLPAGLGGRLKPNLAEKQ